MADEEIPKEKALAKSGDGAPSPQGPQVPSRIIPPQLIEALNKVPDADVKAMLSIALSRTTLGFGPDAETAKIIAESEMHEEDCRLKGYTAQLQSKDSQNKRDHEFRCKRLDREFAINVCGLAAAIAGAGTGLYLLIRGHTEIGSNLLIASAAILLYLLKGTTEFLGK
jgi:hypothetical protein